MPTKKKVTASSLVKKGAFVKVSTKLAKLPQTGKLVWQVKNNPKSKGSDAHKRFQKYCRAKTVDEFRRLGGFGADLRHDCDRGIVKIIKLAAVIASSKKTAGAAHSTRTSTAVHSLSKKPAASHLLKRPATSSPSPSLLKRPAVSHSLLKKPAAAATSSTSPSLLKQPAVSHSLLKKPAAALKKPAPVFEKVVLSAAAIQQRAGKRVIQLLGSNAAGKGTRLRYLVEAEKKRHGEEQTQQWSCNAMGGKNFGILFMPTGLLVLGRPQTKDAAGRPSHGSWSCLDAVPAKGTRLAMMHQALDDPRVREVLWEGFFGFPAGWSTPSAMREEFGESIIVSSYVLFYDTIDEFRRRCMGRVLGSESKKVEQSVEPPPAIQSNVESSDGAPKEQQLEAMGGNAEAVPEAAQQQEGKEASSTLVSSSLQAFFERQQSRFEDLESLQKSSGWQSNLYMTRWFKNHSLEGTAVISGTDAERTRSEHGMFRLSVEAPKDFLWKEICGVPNVIIEEHGPASEERTPALEEPSNGITPPKDQEIVEGDGAEEKKTESMPQLWAEIGT